MKRRFRLYFTSWLLLALGSASLAAAFPDHTSSLLILYCALTWIGAIAIYLYEARVVNEYVRTNYSAEWRAMTRFPGLVSGQNSLAGLFFLFSSHDYGDPILRKLKRNGRLIIFFLVGVFVQYIAIWIVADWWSLRTRGME